MKKTVQNLFTLVIAVLLIINTLPSMVYADEEIPAEDPSQAQVEVISETGNEQTPSDTQQENLTPVQGEKKEESPVNEVKEEVQIKIEEIATEQREVKEEKAEQIVEIKAAEKTENNEAAASLNAAKAVEEKVEEKVEVVIPERIKITYNFNNIIKTDGSRISKNASSTLSVGSGWNITQKKLDNQIPAKNFEVNGDKYVYTGNWIYDDGTPVSTPISFKNTGYAEDQVINLSPVYEITRKVQEETIPAETKPAETKPAETKPAETKEAETKPVEAAQQKAEEIAPAIVEEAPKPDKFTVVINISGIWKSNGTQSSTVVNKTISKGTSSSMALKFFENKLGGYTTVRSNGYTYTYTGQWADENGNILSFPIVCKYADMTQDMEMNIHPIYEVSAPPASLKMNRIDRVSTCGSSWSGQLTGTEWAAHTFRTPDGQTHYQFLYWQDAETGTIYNPGDQLKITAEEIGAGNNKIVNIYTIWQPSVTIRYYDQKGRYLSEKEAFENLNVYDYLPNETAGLKFLGWSEAKNGEVLADNTVYEIPALTSDKVSQKIHNVYAVYSTEYQVEHSLEELDGSYRMEEKENKEAILGSKVEAEENEYEGFAFNEDVIGSVLEGTADPSLVLKLFYNRKSYNVSYQYVNAPENASALPETKSYKYMQPVKVADAASAEGYTFSGWNKENFNMPSGDVVISGSFDINSYKVTYRYENAPANAPALPAEAFYNYKENVEIAAAPQLKGYTFSGWNKENFTMPASDVVISGSFKANSHTVRYELEGDVPANAPALPIAREYSYGEEVTIADDLKLEGYTFSGWDKENFTMDDEDVVIRGSFQINSYKVNYEYENAPANAPALPETKEVKFNSKVEIAAAPTMEGYTFSGWDKEDF
ncbi:MAG: InlB B-repeat-containing protein, partial [Erysipelotrichaceae bacterium]|nr:InlB B-repeat-containing protein [Erysipelotrichaceae bacterium]